MATCGNALLGVCDTPSKELRLSPYENKIGGYPDFFGSSFLPSAPRCTSCGEPLALIVQVYCPLEDSPYHRLLHIFCCSRQHCYERNSGWLALRSQLKDPSYDVGTSTNTSTVLAVPSPPGVSSALSEWCVEADDWGVDEGEHQGSAGGEGNWGEGGDMEGEVKEEMEEGHLKPKTRDGQNNGVCAGLSGGAELNVLDHGNDVPTCTVTHKTLQTESVHDTEVYPLAEKVTALTLNSEQTDGDHGSLSYQGPHFGSFYINVISEPLADENTIEQVEKLLQKYGKETMEEWREPGGEGDKRKGKRKPSGGGSGGAGGRRGGDGGERYEKAVAKHGDRTFQKFHKVMSRCPNQVLRYHWRGVPLLITNKQHVPLPEEVMCRSCGAQCVFELQLMPPLVYILQRNYHSMRGCRDCGIEFGTVLVYSCSRSCWEEEKGGFQQETVIVQTDPDSDMIHQLHH